MEIWHKDIVLIILVICIIYLLYKDFTKKEGFNQSSQTGYQADIEAIRNLSSIATQLTTNNTLTMPGQLNISGSVLSMTNQKPIIDLGAGDTNRQVDSGKIGYNIWEDALNIVGKGNPSEARRISLYDNVKIIGNLNINGSVTNNNKGFMYLIMKVCDNKQFVILDQNNNPLSFNDWVVYINFDSQKGGGYNNQNQIFVGTDNNWQISIYDYDNYIYLLCIPKNWFSYVSKPPISNNLRPISYGRIFYKSDGTITSYKSDGTIQT